MLRSLASEKKKEILEKISHFCVGLPLILKGVDKAEHFSQHPFTVIFLFCAGAFIILGAIFHRGIEKKIPNITAIFHGLEGTALILVGLILLEKSSRLPYFLFFAGVLYLGIGAFGFFTDAAEKKRWRPLLMTVLGIIFLLAAVVFTAFNFFNSGNTWAYITAGVIAIMGLFILFIRKISKKTS
jgi:hypothetical protein